MLKKQKPKAKGEADRPGQEEKVQKGK